MADDTLIEWADATWNPITGCSVVSPGCANCYAMRLAGGRLKAAPSRAGLTLPSRAGPVWTGEVRFNRHWLDQPLRWRRPRRIFVCAHGDLFHEHVPNDWIDQVFAVMALAPQHQFLVLTKRAERVRDYLEITQPRRRITLGDGLLTPLPTCYHQAICETPGFPLAAAERLARRLGRGPGARRRTHAAAARDAGGGALDQRRAAPGAAHARSLDRRAWLAKKRARQARPSRLGRRRRRERPRCAPDAPLLAAPAARRCAKAGVAFFFKQMGRGAPVPAELNFAEAEAWAGGRPLEQHSSGDTLVRVGKRAAGRALDGVEHDAIHGPRATERPDEAGGPTPVQARGGRFYPGGG